MFKWGIFLKYTKLRKPKPGNALAPLPLSQNCASEATAQQLIEIFGIRPLPLGIIELFGRKM